MRLRAKCEALQNKLMSSTPQASDKENIATPSQSGQGDSDNPEEHLKFEHVELR